MVHKETSRNDGIRTGFIVGIMEYGLNWMFEIWDKERRAGMTL